MNIHIIMSLCHFCGYYVIINHIIMSLQCAAKIFAKFALDMPVSF